MVICLIAEGFFSGSEIGVVSADRMKLRHEAAKGSKGAQLALEMLQKPEWLLSTTLVGTNIAVVTNTTMATALMIQLFGPAYSWLAVVLVAPLIWVFGEIVPKSVFQQRADTANAPGDLRAAILLPCSSIPSCWSSASWPACCPGWSAAVARTGIRSPCVKKSRSMMQMSSDEGRYRTHRAGYDPPYCSISARPARARS